MQPQGQRKSQHAGTKIDEVAAKSRNLGNDRKVAAKFGDTIEFGVASAIGLTKTIIGSSSPFASKTLASRLVLVNP